MGSLLNGRLERLEGRMDPPEDPNAEARRKRTRAALSILEAIRVSLRVRRENDGV